jgi:hypothetical protein
MNMRSDLLEVLREHAYEAIAIDECLTMLPTDHGAVVPGHWTKAADSRIASVLSETTLRDELARREKESK